MILKEIARAVGENKLILLATNDPSEEAIADEKIIL